MARHGASEKPMRVRWEEPDGCGCAEPPRRRVRARRGPYWLYVRRVLREVHPDLSISEQAERALEALLEEMSGRLVQEAVSLLCSNRRKTLNERELRSAVCLILPAGLALHAEAEGAKALRKYRGSYAC